MHLSFPTKIVCAHCLAHVPNGCEDLQTCLRQWHDSMKCMLHARLMCRSPHNQAHRIDTMHLHLNLQASAVSGLCCQQARRSGFGCSGCSGCWCLQAVIDEIVNTEYVPVRVNGPIGGDSILSQNYDHLLFVAGGVAVSVASVGVPDSMPKPLSGCSICSII
jgi:hypothetical protein